MGFCCFVFALLLLLFLFFLFLFTIYFLKETGSHFVALAVLEPTI